MLACLFQRHAGGRDASTGCVEGHFGSLQRIQEPRLVAHPATGPGQPLQIVGFERALGVSFEQLGTRYSPVVPTVGRTSIVEDRLAA